MEDILTFYKSRKLRVGSQRWRWRYQAAGNNAKLAHGGEAFGDLNYTMKSAFRVLGLTLNPGDDFEGEGLVKTRPGATDVRVRVRY